MLENPKNDFNLDDWCLVKLWEYIDHEAENKGSNFAPINNGSRLWDVYNKYCIPMPFYGWAGWELKKLVHLVYGEYVQELFGKTEEAYLKKKFFKLFGRDEGQIKESFDNGLAKIKTEIEAECFKVVSLNYDLVLEKLLCNFGIKYYYGINENELENKEGMQIVKPHGSFNLDFPKTIPPQVNGDGEIKFIDFAHKNRIFLKEEIDFWKKDNKEHRPAIINVIKEKKELKEEGNKQGQFTRDRLMEAKAELKKANKIVFIGYSFPDEDEHLKKILFEEIRNDADNKTFEYYLLEKNSKIEKYFDDGGRGPKITFKGAF